MVSGRKYGGRRNWGAVNICGSLACGLVCKQEVLKVLFILFLFLASFDLTGQELKYFESSEYIEIIPHTGMFYAFEKMQIDGKERRFIMPTAMLGVAVKDRRWFSSVGAGIWPVPAIQFSIGIVMRVKK